MMARESSYTSDILLNGPFLTMQKAMTKISWIDLHLWGSLLSQLRLEGVIVSSWREKRVCHPPAQRRQGVFVGAMTVEQQERMAGRLIDMSH